MKSTKGFTLIELLVVIAIIGILSSVVLASLNSARAKGADAAIKSNLANMRAQAELSYDNSGGTYINVCSDTSINNGLSSAKTASGITSATSSLAWTAGTGATANTAVCHSEATGWAVAVSLKSANTSAFCVDYTGQAITTAVLGASSEVCGI